MTVFYKSQKVVDLLGASLPEIRDLSDAGKLVTKLEDGEMLVSADSLADLGDDNAFSFLKNRFPAFAKSRGLGAGSLFSIGSVASLLGADSTSILDMINVGSLGAAVSGGEQMVAGDSLRNFIIGDQSKYGSLIPLLGDFALSQIGLGKVSGFGLPSVAQHLGLGVPGLRSLIDGGTVGTIFDEGNEYVEAESLNRYIQNEPAYADSKYKLGDFIFSQLGFDVTSDASLPSYATEISTDLPDAPDVDGGGIGLGKGAIGAGIAGAGAVGAGIAGLSGKLPDVNVPDINVPDVNLPDVDVPDVDLPQVDFPDVDLPSVDIPDVNLPDAPDVNVPDVDLPNVDLPDATIPGVDLPDVPDVNVPDVDLPRRGVGDVNVPDVDMPRRGVGDVNVPDVDLPSTDVGRIDPPDVGRRIIEESDDDGLPAWLAPALLVASALFAFLLLTGVSERMMEEPDVASSATPVVSNPVGETDGDGGDVAAVDDEPEPTEIPNPIPTVTPSPGPAPTERPDPTRTPRPVTTFYGNVSENDTFSQFAGALSATGLDSVLEEGGPYTVFAPVNRAFGNVPDEIMDSLGDDGLSELLTYHVIEGEFMAEDVIGLDSATTLSGDDVEITVEDGVVFVNGARVIGTDIETENGVMHVLDTVLVPASLIPPEPTEIPEPAESPASNLRNIVEIVGDTDALSTLAGALSATDLLSALEGDGPFTVFAPLDSAFGQLPEGTLESLSEDQLRDVLTYHVVEGKVMAEVVVGLDSATTLQGEEINITVEDGIVFVNDAQVVATDFEAENGVIHLLNNVLIPASLAGDDSTPPEETTDDSEAQTIGSFVQNLDSVSALAGALDATGLTAALEGDGPFTVFAPVNDAFAALPEGTLDALSEDQLREVLLYHVVEGEVGSDVVSGLSSGTTLQGEDFNVTIEDGEVMINGAKLIATDIALNNGIVHVIDTILLPPSLAGGDSGSDGGDDEGTADSGTDSASGDEMAANVHIIMDASWSMTLPPDTNDESQRLDVDDPGNRIALARDALVDLVTNDIPEGTPIGLRAFGNLEGDYSCRTDLMAVPGQLSNDDVAELITEIEPQFNANTPLADSIAAIPADIAQLEGRTVVILITDGAETCFGEPGVAAVSLGAPRSEISLNIIGLSIEDEQTRTNLARIAEIGDGSYYDVTDIDQFSDALKATLE